jgi:hypothetical protein
LQLALAALDGQAELVHLAERAQLDCVGRQWRAASASFLLAAAPARRRSAVRARRQKIIFDCSAEPLEARAKALRQIKSVLELARAEIEVAQLDDELVSDV